MPDSGTFHHQLHNFAIDDALDALGSMLHNMLGRRTLRVLASVVSLTALRNHRADGAVTKLG